MASGDDIDFLIDTFCGCGLFALSAAFKFKSVFGVVELLSSLSGASHSSRLTLLLYAGRKSASTRWWLRSRTPR